MSVEKNSDETVWTVMSRCTIYQKSFFFNVMIETYDIWDTD